MIPGMGTETSVTRTRWSIQHSVVAFTYLNHAFLRSVPGLQYDNIVHVYTGHTNVNNDSLVNTITDSVNQCIKRSQLCKKTVTRRVRDREPSRVSLRRVSHSNVEN